jgi:hypothetical protein
VQASPATVASALLLLAALTLVVLTAVAVRPQEPAVVTQAAPGSQEREPRTRRAQRRGAERRTARPAARSTPAATRTATPAPAGTPAVTAAPAAAPAPTADAAPAAAPALAAVVTDYYRALDAGRFERAWSMLAPAVRTSFGDFEDWRAGYATTLSNSPRDIEVAREGGVTRIAHELVTEDRSACGPVRRVFAVRWELVPAAEGWRVTRLTAAKLAGLEPAEACGARHDAARAAGGS